MRTLNSQNNDLAIPIQPIDGLESVRQRVVQRLLYWRGEWSYDLSEGTPYLTDYLSNRFSEDLIRQTIIAQVLEIDNVNGVRDLEVKYVPRTLSITMRLDTDFGPMEITAAQG